MVSHIILLFGNLHAILLNFLSFPIFFISFIFFILIPNANFRTIKVIILIINIIKLLINSKKVYLKVYLNYLYNSM